jgi:hypothetical protein
LGCCVEADAMVIGVKEEKENHAIEAFHKKKKVKAFCIPKS